MSQEIRSTSILLLCEEGWTYLSWQRVQALIMPTGCNVSKDVADLWNANWSNLEGPTEGGFRVEEGGGAFFVLSGEGFSLEDLAEEIEQVIAIPLRTQDGVDGPIKGAKS